MTAELIAIIAVGVSLAGLILRLNRRIDRLEGLLEGLRDAVVRAAA